ncbi:hypothetical protein VP01_685g2 [Puccinia sorghi]|uniref:Uncharacterized protein n=1 Tax=Puccinia sorghi TaxID=27349 RepID=A0A0L6UGI6_9BASI|nr:hypothetical protein VP01_685g2 [Puccinia sorghi]
MYINNQLNKPGIGFNINNSRSSTIDQSTQENLPLISKTWFSLRSPRTVFKRASLPLELEKASVWYHKSSKFLRKPLRFFQNPHRPCLEYLFLESFLFLKKKTLGTPKTTACSPQKISLYSTSHLVLRYRALQEKPTQLPEVEMQIAFVHKGNLDFNFRHATSIQAVDVQLAFVQNGNLHVYCRQLKNTPTLQKHIKNLIKLPTHLLNFFYHLAFVAKSLQTLASVNLKNIRKKGVIAVMVRAEVPGFVVANQILKVLKMEKKENKIWVDESCIHWIKKHLPSMNSCSAEPPAHFDYSHIDSQMFSDLCLIKSLLKRFTCPSFLFGDLIQVKIVLFGSFQSLIGAFVTPPPSPCGLHKGVTGESSLKLISSSSPRRQRSLLFHLGKHLLILLLHHSSEPYHIAIQHLSVLECLCHELVRDSMLTDLSSQIIEKAILNINPLIAKLQAFVLVKDLITPQSRGFFYHSFSEKKMNLKCFQKYNTEKKDFLNCLQLTCRMLQPICHPKSTCLHMYRVWHSRCSVCKVTVHQILVESLWENGFSNKRSFLGLSACCRLSFFFFFSAQSICKYEHKILCNIPHTTWKKKKNNILEKSLSIIPGKTNLLKKTTSKIFGMNEVELVIYHRLDSRFVRENSLGYRIERRKENNTEETYYIRILLTTTKGLLLHALALRDKVLIFFFIWILVYSRIKLVSSFMDRRLKCNIAHQTTWVYLPIYIFSCHVEDPDDYCVTQFGLDGTLSFFCPILLYCRTLTHPPFSLSLVVGMHNISNYHSSGVIFWQNWDMIPVNLPQRSTKGLFLISIAIPLQVSRRFPWWLKFKIFLILSLIFLVKPGYLTLLSSQDSQIHITLIMNSVSQFRIIMNINFTQSNCQIFLPCQYFFPLDWTGGHVIQAEKELELKECQDFSKSFIYWARLKAFLILVMRVISIPEIKTKIIISKKKDKELCPFTHEAFMHAAHHTFMMTSSMETPPSLWQSVLCPLDQLVDHKEILWNVFRRTCTVEAPHSSFTTVLINFPAAQHQQAVKCMGEPLAVNDYPYNECLYVSF